MWSTDSGDLCENKIKVYSRNVGSSSCYEGYAYLNYKVSPQAATDVTISASPDSPSVPGTSVIFTASASGGSGEYEYQFWHKGPSTNNELQMVQDYSTSDTWTWNTETGDLCDNYVKIKSRSLGSCSYYEAYTYLIYKVSPQAATDVTISALPDSPSVPGTSVTFTASASGGSGAYEYQFWHKGPSTNNELQMVQDYSTSDTWTWTTDTGDLCDNFVKVKSRSLGSCSSSEAYTNLSYKVSPQAATDVIVTASPESPSVPGTTVTFTASASGGSGEYEYQFWHKGPSTNNELQLVQDYSTSSTWTWSTDSGDLCDNYVKVRARSLGSCSSSEAYTYLSYKVSPQPATNVTLSASPESPSVPGTSVTFTSSAAGGTGEYEYQFWHKGPSTNNELQLVQDYSASSTWTWSTDAGDLCDNYVKVKSRSLGSCSSYEAYTYLSYKVSPQAATDVNLSSSPESPSVPGTSVTFTASASGGSGEYEYQFWHNGPSTDNNWQIVQDYSASNSWAWTTNNNDIEVNYIKVKTRSLGSCSSYEAYKYVTYKINSDSIPTVNINANPESILAGQSSTLTWTSTNAETCVIEPGIGSVALSGSMPVTPADTTTYTITATGPNGTATDTVTVTVNYPAPTVTISADPATILSGESSTLTWNSTNADTVVIDQGIGSVPVNGTTTVSPTETTTYTATATGPGGTAAANATITIANSAPVADDQTATLNEDETASITLTASDADGDSLTYQIVSNPSQGTLTGVAPDIIYTPAENYTGSDTFTFKANDGSLDSNTATVTLSIQPANDAPTAVDDTVTTDEDTVINAIAVLANDSDPDGDTLTVGDFIQPTHGTAGSNGDGTLTYTPDVSYNGSDSFTYTVSDGNGGTDTAAVNITINPVNDAPVANDQAVTLSEDETIYITLTATDIDGDALTYQIVTGPSHGTLNGQAPVLNYTPSQNYNGSDIFTFKVNDGSLDSNTATVTLSIQPFNDPPTAVNDFVTTDEDTQIAAIAVLTNDSDPDGDSISIDDFTQPAHGTAGSNGDGTLTYTPEINYNGPDSFTYTITDGNFGSATANVTVTVNAVNDPPVADAGPDQTTLQGNVVTLDGSGSSDIDGDNLTYNWMFVSVPTGSTAALSDSSIVNPTFTADVAGTYEVQLIVNDGTTDSAPDSVSINIVPAPAVEISADPATILTGESSTLTWSSTNANSCVIEPGIGSVALNGSTTVSPTVSTTYTITATGAGGTSTASATVEVSTSIPPTVSISADPSTIHLYADPELNYEYANLTWSSTNADSCVIEPYIGPVDLSGSGWVQPQQTTTYTITATGPGGTATDSVTVTVICEPPEVGIWASPASIQLGESTTLNWFAHLAETCFIAPNIGEVESYGSIEVSPTETTTYTLTAIGCGGTTIASVIVTVNHPPPTVEISPSL